MKTYAILLLSLSLGSVSALAQSSNWTSTAAVIPSAGASTPPAAIAPSATPPLVPYSGAATSSDGKPLTGEAAGVPTHKRNVKPLELSTPGGTCSFGGEGDMACTGAVKSLATTKGGAKTIEMYSMQSPENWIEDFGSGTVHNGVGTVTLDPDFAETITPGAGYHVFLTPRGDSRGLYVANVSSTGFEVHESGSGAATLSFDYRIVAKRRGFEAKRMVDVTEEMAASRDRFVKSKPIPANTKSKE